MKYDLLNINPNLKNYNREEKFARYEYKVQERKIFKELLNKIYNAKNIMNKISVFNEKKQFNYNLTIIKKNYKQKITVLNDVFAVDKILNIKDKKKLKEIQIKYKKDILELKDEYTSLQKKEKYNYKLTQKRLSWEIYLAKLIYLSSDDKSNTFATGIYFKNLGPDLMYNNHNDKLPFVIGFDANYELFNTENNKTYLYLHYDYSRLENHIFGMGLRYTFLNFVELRSGVAFINSEYQFATSLSFLFNLGFMNYRFDVGTKILDSHYGNIVNISLSTTL